MKTLKYILFIPIITLILSLIFYGFGKLYLFGFEKFLEINHSIINTVIATFILGILWNIFKIFARLLTLIIGFVSPDEKFSLITTRIILSLTLVYRVLKIFNLNIEYDKRVIFFVIVFIIFLFRIAFLINKALTEYFKILNEHNNNY